MSNDHTAIKKQVAELQCFVVDFYNIEPIDFSIKIVPAYNSTYTKLLQKQGSEIYISIDNLKVSHILAHEITHTQIPVRNKFFAEGFASLISCKIAGDCSPFWFAEKKVTEVVQNYFGQYVGLQKLVKNMDAFNDFSKFGTRYAHIIAASFIEWIHNSYPNFAGNIVNSINIEPERILLDKCKLTLSCLEQKWLEAIGVALLC